MFNGLKGIALDYDHSALDLHNLQRIYGDLLPQIPITWQDISLVSTSYDCDIPLRELKCAKDNNMNYEIMKIKWILQSILALHAMSEINVPTIDAKGEKITLDLAYQAVALLWAHSSDATHFLCSTANAIALNEEIKKNPVVFDHPLKKMTVFGASVIADGMFDNSKAVIYDANSLSGDGWKGKRDIHEVVIITNLNPKPIPSSISYPVKRGE